MKLKLIAAVAIFVPALVSAQAMTTTTTATNSSSTTEPAVVHHVHHHMHHHTHRTMHKKMMTKDTKVMATPNGTTVTDTTKTMTPN